MDAPTATTEASPEASPRRPIWRRPGWRSALFLAAAVPMVVWGMTQGPLFWARLNASLLQRECCQYAPEPGTVVYEEDPVAARTLFLQSTEYRALGDMVRGGLKEFTPVFDEPIACRRTPPWESLWAPTVISLETLHDNKLIQGGLVLNNATLFLHARKAGGVERLVRVEFCADIFAAPPRLVPSGIRASTYQLGGWGEVPICLRSVAVPAVRFRRPVAPNQPERLGTLRFFAGQADPADDSRFTIAYQLDATRGQIAGQLQPDGRTIALADVP